MRLDGQFDFANIWLKTRIVGCVVATLVTPIVFNSQAAQPFGYYIIHKRAYSDSVADFYASTLICAAIGSFVFIFRRIWLFYSA